VSICVTCVHSLFMYSDIDRYRYVYIQVYIYTYAIIYGLGGLESDDQFRVVRVGDIVRVVI